MKKIILTLVTIFATGFAAMADTSLDQAYTSLSKLSGMSEKSVGTVQVDNNATLKNIKTSVVTANQGNVQDYRDKFIYMMENLPIRDMVIGANNQRELALLFMLFLPVAVSITCLSFKEMCLTETSPLLMVRQTKQV